MSESASLARRLGFWSSVGLVIGITIGSGIFRTPAVIAGRVPDPLLMMGVWLIGGLITLCGALTIAELATSMPQTGGVYIYLREGWGRPAAFLFGWAELTLIRAAALAGISSVFSEYFLRSFGVESTGTADYVAAAAILCATMINARGVQIGAAVVGLSTISKFAALLFLVAASFLLGGGHGASVSHFASQDVPVQAGLFGLALISVLWAYDGFADLSFAGGEVADPQRNLPRAIVGGTLAIIGIYLAANAAYLYVSPIARVASSPAIAADTMRALFGDIGLAIVSVVVTVSTFGALIGSMLVGPRIFFAMADDGLFFRRLAVVHARYRTPVASIVFTALLGIVFVLAGTFEQLADIFVLATWPFYALGIAAIYRLRATRPDLPRPYKAIGYPVVPAIFIAAVLYLITNALVTDPLWTSLTFGIVLLGIPVYYVVFASKGAKTT